jgi:hypothetical protein
VYPINKIISLPYDPFHKEPVELRILELVETITPFKPVSHVDKAELQPHRGRRRFLIKAAYGTGDK